MITTHLAKAARDWKLTIGGPVTPLVPVMALCGVLAAWAPALGQARPAPEQEVRLEIVYQPGAPITAAQQWLEVLRRAGVKPVRIGADRGGTRPEIHRQSRPSTTAGGAGITGVTGVTGVIGRDNRLQLPDASFSLTEAGRIPAYLQKIAEPPRRSSDEERGGLRKQLSVPVAESTAGLQLPDVLRRLARQLDLPVDIAPLAREAVLQEGTLEEELKGVSVGTALAYILYQRGAVLVPRGDPARRLRIERPRREQTAWPIGHADSRQAARRLPRLLDFLPVAIRHTPLPTVLSALQERLEVPVLFDHPAMVERGIRMDQVLVTLPEGQTYYKKVLDQALFQARLQAHVRLDDAGRPFLWITIIGRPSSDEGP